MQDKISKWYQYSKERFPLWQFFLLCLLFSVSGGLLIQKSLSLSTNSYLPILLFFVALFLFLLRLRLFDEFKDLEHDFLYYPQRPVPRGLIKLSELKPVIGGIIILELLISFYNGVNSFIIFIFTFLYSLILFKEFFIPAWLKKHFTLYILSHELIALPLFFYLFSLNGFKIVQVTQPLFWIICFFFVLQLFLLEITRKIRSKKEEVASKDTYSAQYGAIGASLLTVAVAILVGFIYFRLLINLVGWSKLSYLPLLFFMLLVRSIFIFMKDNTSKNSRLIFLSTVFFIFAINFVVILILL